MIALSDRGILQMAGPGHEHSVKTARGSLLFEFLVVTALLLGVVSCGSEKAAPTTLKTAVPQEQAASVSDKMREHTSAISPGTSHANHVAADASGSLTANSMDMKSVSIEPAAPSAGDTLRAMVIFNEDAPPVTSLYFHWKINDQTVQESPSSELQRPTKKGDRVEVIVFVGNKNDESRAVSGHASIENTPPSIRKVDERLDENGQYVARLESLDKDGDSVNLALQRGPEGMTLDGTTRELHWPVPKGTKGSFPVEVLVGDGSGAQILFAYSITIRQE